MIDLRANPFYLDDEAVAWVEQTKASMTTEEKIGQLFVPIGYSGDPAYLENAMLRYHIGGIMYRSAPSAEARATHTYLQEHSRIPLLIGANLEAGGDGIALDGTAFGKQMQVAATNDAEQAYRLGKVSCAEGRAVGVNWSFAPVVDIDRNYHNPITNVRTYGSDPEKVLQFALAYKRGADEEGLAVAVKHFPGDGCDEVDQHILVSVNDLSCEEWEEIYGKVYRGLIEDGALTCMVGHIAQPAWQTRLDGKRTDALIPATLSPALLQGLLREHLGFNGLISTDSTCMVGFNVLMPRSQSVPYAIEAGCDMFLFNKDLGEDFAYMKAGLENGILSRRRLDEAVTRILAAKAALGLHRQRMAPPETMKVIGCPQHLAWAEECADQAVTLVKDTQKVLPLSSQRTPKVLLEVLGDYPSAPRVRDTYKKLLEEAGFAVTVYERETFETADFKVETFRSRYDLVLYVGNMENASNQVTNRYQWFTFWGNGNNCPWFTAERPVVYVSHANPYALLDAPQIRTYINAYSNHDGMIRAVVDKLLGKSEFKGISPIDPFCGKDYLAY